MLIPKDKTLKKYGLTGDVWRAIYLSQGGICPICKKPPKSGRLVTDHEHVKGYKKMLPAERSKYVRGLLCIYCNLRVLHKGITLDKLINAVAYLMEYEKRKRRMLYHAAVRLAGTHS